MSRTVYFSRPCEMSHLLLYSITYIKSCSLLFSLDLQKLCSTLANVNLCELAEDDERTSSSRAIAASNVPSNQAEFRSSYPVSSSFNSTMISGTFHLNELQKENRAPPPCNNLSIASPNRSNLTSHISATSSTSASILSDTVTTLENYHI
jgi:hypothetical protein